MFDANIRCLPKGTYFADVICCTEGELFDLGVRTGDVVVFDKLGDDTNNPEIKVYGRRGEVILQENLDLDGINTWLVFAGYYDLTGFIDKESLNKAKKLKGI